MMPRRIEPGPGQESVWDYPRPPAIAPDARLVVIEHQGIEVARTNRAIRILETASPPTWYLPFADVRMDLVVAASGASVCEWKGRASYWSLQIDGRVTPEVAWSYPNPNRTYHVLRDHIAFYAGRVDRVTVDGQVVRPQPGGFYGGWITDEVVGPFKGEPGTLHW